MTQQQAMNFFNHAKEDYMHEYKKPNLFMAAMKSRNVIRFSDDGEYILKPVNVWDYIQLLKKAHEASQRVAKLSDPAWGVSDAYMHNFKEVAI